MMLTFTGPLSDKGIVEEVQSKLMMLRRMIVVLLLNCLPFVPTSLPYHHRIAVVLTTFALTLISYSVGFGCVSKCVFLHVMSKHRFVNICHHFDAHGLLERVHGNGQKRAHNMCTPDQLKNLVTFIDYIAQAHAIPLPGCLPNHRDDCALLLPTDLTKAKVFRM